MSDNTRGDSFAKAVNESIRTIIGRMVYTATIGSVIKYDANTKRAVIQPVVLRSFVDGRESIEQAPLVDVPVIQPASGGYQIHQQIDTGDMMLVLFTKEGLDSFKAKWETGVEPTKGKLFTDAVAMRFGVETIEPVSDEGIVLQSANGNSYIHLTDDSINMKVGRGRLRLTSSNFDAWRE